MTWNDWWKHLNLLNIVLIIVIPLIGVYSAFYVPLRLRTLAWAVLYYFNTGLGITAGQSPPLSARLAWHC